MNDDIEQDRSPAENAVAEAAGPPPKSQIELADMRLAAALNLVEMARPNDGTREWTAEHAKQIRAILAFADAVVAGGSISAVLRTFLPPGRSEPPRAALGKAGDKRLGEL